MTEDLPGPVPPAPHPKDHFFDVGGIGRQAGSLSGRSGAFTIFSSLVKAVLLIVTTAVMARLIPPAEFGVIALAMPILFLATSLSQMGLTQAIAQKDVMTHALASDLFWLGLMVGGVISLLMIPLGQVMAISFAAPRAALVFPVLGLSIFFGTIMGQFLALYWRRLRIPETEVMNVTAIVVSSAAGILAALAGASYWAVVIQQVMLPFTNMILLAWRMGWLPSRPRRVNWGDLRDSVRFGGYLALANVLFQVSQSLGVLFAGRVFSEVQASLYYRAWNLSRMPASLLLLPLGSTFIPAFSRLQTEPDAFRALFLRSLSRLSFILTPVGVAICAAAPDIIRIMLGAQWLAAAPVFAVLGVRVILGTFGNGFRWTLVASGQGHVLFWLALFHLPFMCAAFFVGQSYGVFGLAAAGVAADSFVTVVIVGLLAVRYTALARADLRRLAVEITLYAGVLGLVSVAVLRAVRDFGSPLRLACVLGAMAAVAGLRLVLDANLRADVAKALPGLRNRVLRRR